MRRNRNSSIAILRRDPDNQNIQAILHTRCSPSKVSQKQGFPVSNKRKHPESRSIIPVRTIGLIIAIGLAVLMGLNLRFGPSSGEKSGEDENTPLVERSDPPEKLIDGMVWIEGGPYWRGTDDAHFSDDHPRRKIAVSGFWMDATEVTNAQFSAFVKATGYRTIAEKPVKLSDYRIGTDPKAEGPPFSAVFHLVGPDVSLQGPWQTGHPPWWTAVEGADWQHPEGPNSLIVGREKHPVVHIAWDDAVEYAKWAKKRLPTEAEWEFAARGGLDRNEFCWGNESPGADGKWRANIWQGQFPVKNTAKDGYERTSPVGSFPANGYGLYDTSGNAWEWCSDWYDDRYYRESPRNNPKGPEIGTERVRRGGSFLCCDQYCRRYVPSARDKNPPDSGASHTGFRCVKDR